MTPPSSPRAGRSTVSAAGEPRTEAGRDLMQRVHGKGDLPEWAYNDDLAAILAIEAEAAQGAAPLHGHNYGGDWIECTDQHDNWTSNADTIPIHDHTADRPTTEPSEGAAPLDMSCDRIVNNGMGEPTECGRSYPCDLHDEGAAPRAEGPECSVCGSTSPGHMQRLHEEVISARAERDAIADDEQAAVDELLAAPRAEGLDVERLIDTSAAALILEGVRELQRNRGRLSKVTVEDMRRLLLLVVDASARLSRPSDERVPESEEPR